MWLVLRQRLFAINTLVSLSLYTHTYISWEILVPFLHPLLQVFNRLIFVQRLLFFPSHIRYSTVYPHKNNDFFFCAISIQLPLATLTPTQSFFAWLLFFWIFLQDWVAFSLIIGTLFKRGLPVLSLRMFYVAFYSLHVITCTVISCSATTWF